MGAELQSEADGLHPEFLTERKLLDYGTLCKKTDEVTARFHELSDQIKAAEVRMAEIAVMKKHIINYAKTRDVYVAYRKAGYSKKFLAEHEADILLHKAAKKAFDEMGVKKLPTVKSLQAEYAALLSEKKKLYLNTPASGRKCGICRWQEPMLPG